MRTIRFELRAYPGNDDGEIADRPTVTTEALPGPTEAKRFAGRMAAKIKGPVDLAYAYEPGEPGEEDWNDRYITTLSPCQFASQGYRSERLT